MKKIISFLVITSLLFTTIGINLSPQAESYIDSIRAQYSNPIETNYNNAVENLLITDNTSLKLFVMTGLLGGFTTFSTYLLNFSTLINGNNYIEAFLYLLLSIVIGLIALMLGMKCMTFIG